MQPDQIYLTDIHRLLLGQAPWTFLFEVLLRSLFVYIILLVAARMMGKRVAGQMSVLELTIVVTLGAAIGVPLQAPDRGMVPAVLILLVAVLYQRGLNFWSFKSRRAELTLQGDVSTIVKDGCLDLGEMQRTVISRERLYAILRQHGVIHLGQVKRAYLEADGHFSVYTTKQSIPGLCLIPEIDVKAFLDQFALHGQWACKSCGLVAEKRREGEGKCERCSGTDWSPAVREDTVDAFTSGGVEHSRI